MQVVYAGCFGLSPAITSHFAVEMCAAVAVKNCGKFIKKPIFGDSGLFKVIDVD